MCTRDETSCLSSKILILAHSCSLSSQQWIHWSNLKKWCSMSEPTSFNKFLKWNKTKMKLSAYFMKKPVHTSICRCLISCSFYVINFSHAPKSCVGLCVVQVGGNQDQLCLYVCICCFRTMHMLIQLHCICSAGLVWNNAPSTILTGHGSGWLLPAPISEESTSPTGTMRNNQQWSHN